MSDAIGGFFATFCGKLIKRGPWAARKRLHARLAKYVAYERQAGAADHATSVVIQTAQNTVSVALRRPLTIGEIWARFAISSKRPALVTLSRGVAHITF